MGEFIGSDGEPVAFAEQNGWWHASIRSAGTVTVTTYTSDSPSAYGILSWTVAGVEPGDRFPRQPPPLPVGCECSAVDLVPDDTGYSWTDRDAKTVDARVIMTFRELGPFVAGFGGTEVDHEVDTHIPTPTTPGVSVTVKVVRCQNDEWARLRPALTNGC